MDNQKDTIKNLFSELIATNRIPHAVLIEGGTEQIRQEAVRFLAQYAVCTGDTRPCMHCKGCKNATNLNHSDIYIPKLSGKTNIISIDAIRDLIKDASIIANESDTKVFILEEVDKRMSDVVQNAFLKILEEPPLQSLFILTADNAKSLLSTILSRVQVFSIKKEQSSNEEFIALAQDIVSGILSVSELKLLYATAKLKDRNTMRETLSIVMEYLRLALNKSVGVETDDEYAVSVAKKLTRSRIINLIELTSQAISKTDRNVNMTLLSTWLCGEYRRISWQR